MRKIFVAGDMTITGLERSLARSLGRHIRTQGEWQVRDLGFNSWLVEALNPRSTLYREPPDILAVILSPRFLQHDHDPVQNVRHFLDAIGQHRSGMQVFFTTVVADPLAGQQLPAGTVLHEKAAKANEMLLEWQRVHPWFHIVDMQSFMVQHGIDRVHDPRYEVMARMYLSPGGIKLLADSLARYVGALGSPTKKVLVLDLDDTLWGGILGEDGLNGIRVGGENDGYSFLTFQRSLLTLKATGVLLAICSKNNEPDALRALESHPDILLRPTDFACHRINWKPKAENLREIAHELNLGLDSFVFFDDSAFERGQMRELLPEVDVLEVPSDPALYARTLAQYPGFDTLRVTIEDRKRSEMYAAESRRKMLQRQSGSLEEFYRSLEMRAVISRATETKFERVFQLIQKTNQFNLTTRRYTEKELRSLLTSPRDDVYTLRLSDKLGESGVTGVAVVRKGTENWQLDNFLLSCRIIGRTVEYAFIRWLAARGRAAGAARIIAEFIPTPRNAVASMFLETAGFERNPASGKWALDLARWEGRVPPDYVRVDEAEQQCGLTSTN